MWGSVGVACGSPSASVTGSSGHDPSATATATTSTGGPTSGGSAGSDSGSESTGGVPKFDLPTTPDLPGEVDECKRVDNFGEVGECSESAAPGSFSPSIQWSWMPSPERYSLVTPLVANLTDDNGDGEVDLCDTPDIVVVLFAQQIAWPTQDGWISILDGGSGTEHIRFADPVNFTVTPALGDIDNDGDIEIVTIDRMNNVRAFDADGNTEWIGDKWSGSESHGGAMGIADLNNDGAPEIFGGGHVFDNQGNLQWVAGHTPGQYAASLAADLNNDGDLELVLGASAYNPDGSLFYLNTSVKPGFPQVGDFDGDNSPRPEILITNEDGITILEANAQPLHQDKTPTADPASGLNWLRPAAVFPEVIGVANQGALFSMSSSDHYTVFAGDTSVVWSTTVSDQSGIAAGTAFDFLGDGTPEAMYGDEKHLFVFDHLGGVVFKIKRTSQTSIELPVVSDIDNDGSSEIVVTSSHNGLNFLNPAPPVVQVIGDRHNRWVQSRRIWNQHTYHVTNVNEDGSIPQFEQPNWMIFNTFRVNAQIDGDPCIPPQG